MILMNDFKSEPAELRKSMIAASTRVLESGWYVLGNEVATFEKQWASICGVAHGVGVGNGMDAIEIAIRLLEIGRGDEVVTSPMTAFATVLAILRAGATPVLADVDLDSALLSMESVERCISPKTKAVLLVHIYGQLRNMDSWVAFCKRRNLALIEDCAQAHMATWKGKVAGSFGNAGAYSFYPTKNLGAPGDAGMIVTHDPVFAKRAESLRNYGQSVRYNHPVIGMNSRLDELQAAILKVRLKWLPEFTERRRKIAGAYQKGIKNNLIRKLAEPEEQLAHVYHLFVVQCDQRERLQDHFQSNQIQTLIHYPIPIHKQESCLAIKRDTHGLRNSENHASTCLSLPCHPQMNARDVAKVIEIANSFN